MWPEGADGPAPMMSVTSLPHDGEGDPERLECPRGDTLALVDQAEEDVLGADVVVVQEARFLLSQHDHATGPVGEALEHGHSMPRQTAAVRALASAGAGFLLAVLWFDLMFDVQVRGHAADVLPERVRTSIATYYARVTTTSRPMSRLVVLAMLTAIGAEIALLFGDDLPNWRAAIALVLTLVAVEPRRCAHRAGGGAARRARRRRGDPVEARSRHPPRSPRVHHRHRGDAAPAAAPRVSRWRPKAPTDHVAHTGPGRDQVSNFKPYVSSNPRMQNGRSGHSGGPPIVS